MGTGSCTGDQLILRVLWVPSWYGMGTLYSAGRVVLPRVWTPYAAQGVREVGSGWRCSHCLNKHTRITGVITRAIIRITITAARVITISVLNTAGGGGGGGGEEVLQL